MTTTTTTTYESYQEYIAFEEKYASEITSFDSIETIGDFIKHFGKFPIEKHVPVVEYSIPEGIKFNVVIEEHLMIPQSQNISFHTIIHKLRTFFQDFTILGNIYGHKKTILVLNYMDSFLFVFMTLGCLDEFSNIIEVIEDTTRVLRDKKQNYQLFMSSYFNNDRLIVIPQQQFIEQTLEREVNRFIAKLGQVGRKMLSQQKSSKITDITVICE
jgi:hypothetical protein